jgi:membrane protease YdiL (CAAX protease family)
VGADLSHVPGRAGLDAASAQSGSDYFTPIPVRAEPAWMPLQREPYADPASAWRPPPRPVRFAETGLSWWEGLSVTALALLSSFVLEVISHHQHVGQVDHALRAGLFLTLVFYVVLGVAVAAYVVRRNVHLVWSRQGGPAAALTFGVPLGLALGGLGVLVNSLTNGRLSGDSGNELLVGGGGFLRLALAFVAAAVLAPLVEETVFRGICAGSMLAKGPAPALLTSAGAFAVWHMTMPLLQYYALMGLMLGGVWRRRGLIGSMATHAAFNGVLVFAAIAATGGSGQLTTWESVSFVLPGGWHAHPVTATTMGYDGPAATGLAINRTVPAQLPAVPDLLARLRRGSSAPGMGVVPGTEHVVSIGGVDAAMADIVTVGQPGHVVMAATGGSVYTLIMITSGSPKAEADWHEVLTSLRLR